MCTVCTFTCTPGSLQEGLIEIISIVLFSWFGELQLLQVYHCLPVDCSLALLHNYGWADDVSFL